MENFLQLLVASNNPQNAFAMLYNLYKTINAANSKDLIAFWQTLATFKSEVSNQNVLKKISDLQDAIVQRMKELSSEVDVKFMVIDSHKANPITFAEKFGNVIGIPLHQWKKSS